MVHTEFNNFRQLIDEKIKFYTYSLDIPTSLSLIDSAFCGQTFLWNAGAIPESNLEYTDIDSDSVNIINRTINSFHSPTNEAEIVWIAESDDQIEIYSTTDTIGPNFIYSLFDVSINPQEEFEELLEYTDIPVQELDISYPTVTIVEDDPFQSLLQFICSQQMSMDRIHSLNQSLSKEFGEVKTIGEYEYFAYPRPVDLHMVSEDKLRGLSFGYRSEYIVKTIDQIQRSDPNLPARDEVTSEDTLHSVLCEYYGVGDKIADCVQLYGYNQLNIVPIDTWMEQFADKIYPSKDLTSYEEYQESLQSYFRPNKAGLDQLYIYDLLTNSQLMEKM